MTVFRINQTAIAFWFISQDSSKYTFLRSIIPTSIWYNYTYYTNNLTDNLTDTLTI